MPGIVVGVDQSEHAHLALGWAMREAGIRGEALTVISIVTAEASPWTGHPLTVPDADNAVARARQAAEEAVAKSAGQLGDRQPSSVTVNAVVGFPVQALVDASHDADLLVVGSRGAGGFGELLLGSVSSQVSHHATCPVVIVPSRRRLKRGAQA
jgi:nucleotide-binding universal stress UspA family protein